MSREDLRTAVVFDRDSTLAYTRPRWHLSPMKDPASSWRVYAAACMGDYPMPGPIAAARLHHPYHRIHICSGMDGSAYDTAAAWNALHGVPCDEMRLRPPDDETSNEDLKVNYILELRSRGIEPVLFFEDWGPAATGIWERTGVPVVGVTPFYPEDSAEFQQAALDGMGGGL